MSEMEGKLKEQSGHNKDLGLVIDDLHSQLKEASVALEEERSKRQELEQEKFYLEARLKQAEDNFLNMGQSAPKKVKRAKTQLKSDLNLSEILGTDQVEQENTSMLIHDILPDDFAEAKKPVANC
jgi:hypothetical protein